MAVLKVEFPSLKVFKSEREQLHIVTDQDRGYQDAEVAIKAGSFDIFLSELKQRIIDQQSLPAYEKGVRLALTDAINYHFRQYLIAVVSFQFDKAETIIFSKTELERRLVFLASRSIKTPKNF